ncbi:MAG: hypothetical protein ABW065_02365 [Solirubrobacterales bacterium]
MGDQARSLKLGKRLLGPARGPLREVDRLHLCGGENPMLAERAKQLAARLRNSQARTCPHFHADPQVSAPSAGENRCVTSGEVRWQASSAGDAKKIEKTMSAALSAFVMF